MARCNRCGREIEWIVNEAGTDVAAVDPEPVFVVEGAGPYSFYDDMGRLFVGRPAGPEEAGPLEVGFVPHWRTCSHF